MIHKQEFINIECDHCGCLLDEEYWQQDMASINELLDSRDWRIFGGRHYCSDCWQYDDNNNIVTNDGRLWTEDGEEIK